MPSRYIAAVADSTARDIVAAGVPLNPDVAPLLFQIDENAFVTQNPETEVWSKLLSNRDSGVVQTARVTLSTAQANAGATLLPAIAGYKYRLIDWTMIAIGGNAATATSVRLRATQATSAVSLAVVAVAALTRSTAVKPNSANVTNLADGAAFAANDANTPIDLDVDNDNLATATGIHVILQFVVEPE
jgi:hypothetical protein